MTRDLSQWTVTHAAQKIKALKMVKIFKFCLDENEDLRVQSYLKLTDLNFDSPIVHGKQSKLEGKLSFFGSKSANGKK